MNIKQKYNVLYKIKELYSVIEDDIIRVIYRDELLKYNIEFEKLEKDFLQKKQEIEKINKNIDINIKNNIKNEKW